MVDDYNFLNLVGNGIAIGAIVVLIVGMLGYIISKFIKIMIGRV